MEKEHIYEDRERENEKENESEWERTKVLRCNAWVRWTPVETARPFLDHVVLFFIVHHASAVLDVESSFSLRPCAYLLPFFRGFCLRWKGNHGALRVTGPAVFFSSREGQPSPSSSFQLSLSRLVLFSLFVHSSFVSFVPSAVLVRDPLLHWLVMTKSCTSVNRHPPLPVFFG